MSEHKQKSEAIFNRSDHSKSLTPPAEQGDLGRLEKYVNIGATKPANRWPAMEPLLAELRRDGTIVRRRLTTSVALVGVAGLAPLADFTDHTDRSGRELLVTQPATADQLAAAAGLLMWKAAGVPVVVIVGFPIAGDGTVKDALLRDASADLFR